MRGIIAFVSAMPRSFYDHYGKALHEASILSVIFLINLSILYFGSQVTDRQLIEAAKQLNVPTWVAVIYIGFFVLFFAYKNSNNTINLIFSKSLDAFSDAFIGFASLPFFVLLVSIINHKPAWVFLFLFAILFYSAIIIKKAVDTMKDINTFEDKLKFGILSIPSFFLAKAIQYFTYR